MSPEDHEAITKNIFVCAFERREPEAWNRKSSTVPLENEIMAICQVTQNLNDVQYEPQSPDPGTCDAIMQGVRLMLTQFAASCPGFANQLKQLLINKEKAVDMSRNNQCWNCGQAGHVRARCPHPRKHHSTDFAKG